MAVAAEISESGGLPAPSPACVALAAYLFATLAADEGTRIGLVGDSGTGKTTAARLLLAAWLASFPGVALVHDDTRPFAQYRGGQEREDVADLARRPMEQEPRFISFRGNWSQRRRADPEPIAGLAWRLVGRRPPRPVLTVWDEIARAARAGRWNHPRGCPSRMKPPLECTCELPGIFSWGRGSNLSAIWTTRSPQEAPLEVFEQSSHLLVFHMAGIGLQRLRKVGYTDPTVERSILALPDCNSPNRGDFVLLRRGVPWDGEIRKM